LGHLVETESGVVSSDSDSCLGRLAFRVLGPVEVRVGDKVVDLGRPRFRAVLAYLLTHPNRIVSTDQLIEALWGGAMPSTARAQIQQASRCFGGR
jgi:DNA-binding SARP family transcriptional activator